MTEVDKIEAIKTELKLEYRKNHSIPWIIGFSGGKDSSIMLHLAMESILELPPSKRTRSVHIIANDTLVESPIVAKYVDGVLDRISKATSGLNLPFYVQKTTPATNNTFWVNLIGRGYPAPTKFFRWCTSRLKIRPTTQYIHEKVSEAGEAILLLGVRRSESAERAKTAKRYDNGERLNRHNDIPNCYVFRPILELDLEEVWNFLGDNDAPWGGSHRELIELYQNASGDECMMVIDPDAAPSCGSSSVRFGCWTCTVVKKDRSFRSLLALEHDYLSPMVEFRDWLKEFCYTDENRMNTRRNGDDGKGPLTFSSRELVLRELLNLQEKVNLVLIHSEEIREIQKIWVEDKANSLINISDKMMNIMNEVST